MKNSRLTTVLLTAVLLVGAANLGAFAATGGPLLLGKSNTSDKTTKLKTTGKGAALSLKSKSDEAPLAVSNDTKVAKLNADSIDGLDSSALRTTSYTYTLSGTSTTNFLRFNLSGLPAGHYTAAYYVSTLINGGGTQASCYFYSGVPLDKPQVYATGTSIGGPNNWFISGGGPLDTTVNTYRFVCDKGGGTSMTVPATTQGLARLVLTKIDQEVPATLTGVDGP